MGAVSPIKHGGCTNLMERRNCKLVYVVCPLQHGDTFARRHASAIASNSIAFVSVIDHWSLLLLWKCAGSKLPVREYCLHSLKSHGTPLITSERRISLM